MSLPRTYSGPDFPSVLVLLLKFRSMASLSLSSSSCDVLLADPSRPCHLLAVARLKFIGIAAAVGCLDRYLGRHDHDGFVRGRARWTPSKEVISIRRPARRGMGIEVLRRSRWVGPNNHDKNVRVFHFDGRSIFSGVLAVGGGVLLIG